MNSNYLQVANSPVLWLACFPLVFLVLYQSILFTRRAINTAGKMGIDKATCMKAFRSGMISAIGPAVAVFLMMLGLITAVGAPITWMRLSVICAAAGEMIHAGLGAQAMGSSLGGANFSLQAYSGTLWAMTFFSVAWIPVIVFIPQANKLQIKVEKYDKNLMALISTASMLGIMSFMTVQNVFRGWPTITACLVAALGMYGLSRTGKKFPWLKEYHMGIAMIVAIAIAAIVEHSIGG